MEKSVKEKTGWKIITPGLSVKVEGMKGPVAEGEFSKAKEFGKRIAKQLIK